MLLLICLVSLMLASPTLSQMRILSSPNSPVVTRPPPCATTCSGISTETERWAAWQGKGNKYIHMEKCKFVDSPVFTATVIGKKCPTVHVFAITKDLVDLVTVGDASTVELTHVNKCHVMWMASGFNC